MTTVPVPDAPGKYEVLFNGSSLSCYDDTDCPGAGICAINQTWSVRPGGWCMCYTRGGLAGENCNEICGLGVARVVLGVITVTMGLIVAAVAVLALYNANRKRKRWSDAFNVLNLTLVTITTGSLLLSAYILMNFVNTLGFASYYMIIVGKNGRLLKMNPQANEYATFILLVLAQCVSVNAPLLFPLVWIDLANGAFKFKTSSLNAIKSVSIAFCVLVCFVQFPLYVLAANNYQGQLFYFGEIAAIIWYVVYGFLIILNLAAAMKVLQVRKEVTARPKNEVNDRFLSVLDRVFIAAILMVAFFAATIGLIVGAQLRQLRTYYNDPTCNVVNGSPLTLSDVCLRFVAVFIQATTAVCLWFIYPDTKRMSRTPSGGGGTPQRPGRLSPEGNRSPRSPQRQKAPNVRPTAREFKQVAHTDNSEYHRPIRSDIPALQSDSASAQIEAVQEQMAVV